VNVRGSIAPGFSPGIKKPIRLIRAFTPFKPEGFSYEKSPGLKVSPFEKLKPFFVKVQRTGDVCRKNAPTQTKGAAHRNNHF